MGGTGDFVFGDAFPGFRRMLHRSREIPGVLGFFDEGFDSGRGIVPRPQKMVLPAGSGIFCSFGLFCLRNKLYSGK